MSQKLASPKSQKVAKLSRKGGGTTRKKKATPVKTNTTPDKEISSDTTTTDPKSLAKTSDEEKNYNNKRVYNESTNDTKMESKRPHLEPVKTPDDRLTSARTHNNLMDITTNPRLP